jgi:biopolymer transport protein TolQ
MFDIISGAGPIVLAVLVLLVVASVSSWAVIVFKFRELGAADRQTRAFLETYQGGTLEAVYGEAKRYRASPLGAVFRAGFRELAQLEKMQGTQTPITREQTETVIQRLAWVQTDESLRLERGLSFLATVGSAAPFVGLFGTVVGIMNAFEQIGATGSASFAVVAPGIAEALFATAVGLFAAIPAVIAYNYCSARVGRLLERLQAFTDDYADLLRRSISRAA